MNPRRAAPFNRRILAGAPRVLAALIALTAPIARADSTTVAHAVTATPPLQAVPATPVSKNLQQRMRGCNASADAKKLQTAARETFIKSCMAPRRAHAPSRPGSQPKPNP